MMRRENTFTLIGDINETRESARRVREIVTPETFKKIDFHGKIRETFEQRRKGVPLIDDVIEGKTTFYEEVRKYTGPKGQAYYPHFKKINNDDLIQIEMCVGNFYGDHLDDVLGNPLGLTITTLGAVVALSEIPGRMIKFYSKSKKKLLRREFLKLFSPAIAVSTLGGIYFSKGKYALYEKAEKNAMILDYLTKKLYHR